MTFDCVGVGICPLDHLALLKAYPRSDDKTQAVAWETQGGGAAPTAMATLARFGRKVAVVSSVGSGNTGKQALAELSRAGISVRGVKRISGEPHPVSHIWIDRRNAKRTIVLTQKLTHLKNLSRIQKEIIAHSKMVLIDGTEPDAGLAAAGLAGRLGIPTMLDAGSIREATLDLLQTCDMVIGSEQFARQWMPDAGVREVVAHLHGKGARLAGITLGRKGAVLCENRKWVRQKAYKVKAMDTTGAGDVYHGAFIEGILRKWPIEKTARFAAVVAALKCTQIGGRKGIPTFGQAVRRLSTFC